MNSRTPKHSRGLVWWIWKQLFFTFLFILGCFQLSYFFDYHSNTYSACSFPRVEVYTEAVIDYFKLNPFYANCDKIPLLFNSTLNGTIVPVKRKEEFNELGVKNCCYKQFWAVGTDDNSIKFGDGCHPLSLEEETRIPDKHEFISIWCEKDNAQQLFDFHAFTPVKPEVEERLNKVQERKRVNVVILGIDSVSRINFERVMPNTSAYLKELGAVEMTGYNKVGDNTYPNILPFLASQSASEVDWGCGWSKTFDTCPFIWKAYAEKGYRTSYSEEGDKKVDGTAFNYIRKGFKEQPTHYYMRPLAVAFWKSDIVTTKQLCYGPRFAFQNVLDHVKKFVDKMNSIEKPYFQFAWTAHAHDHVRAGEIGDRPVLDLLKWMNNSGYLNNTVFILMSDHGLRFTSFRETLQGQIEDRLPFVHILLPDWIKAKYLRAYQHLLENREKLVTTYDLHEVLVDLLSLEMEDDQIEKRTAALTNELVLNSTISRGISLFLPIPKERTCAMAQIDPNYCSCNAMREIPLGGEEAMKAASVAVAQINSITKPFKDCAVLEVSQVLIAQSVSEAVGVWQGIKINFETKPSKGTFEALVQAGQSEEWKVVGTISRTNLYGNSSFCVNDTFVKLYCYCV